MCQILDFTAYKKAHPKSADVFKDAYATAMKCMYDKALILQTLNKFRVCQGQDMLEELPDDLKE